MDWMKSCLAVIGLCTVLLVGSCVVGFAGFRGVIDPQSASGRIEKPAAEVKQAVYDYLDGATAGRFAGRAKVDYMSDGTMRLHVGKAEPYEMTMSVAFEPDGDTATKVSATFNADNLAWSQPEKTLSTNLHRCIRDDFELFIHNVQNDREGGSLDLDDVIARSRQQGPGTLCYRPPVSMASES